MEKSSISDVWLGSEYTSEKNISPECMVPEAAICKYTKIFLQNLTKSLNPSQKEGKYEKNTRNISSKLDKFSAIAMECLSATWMSSISQLE